MIVRKSVALVALAALLAGCASPQIVTRSAGIDLVSAVAVTGMYR